MPVQHDTLFDHAQSLAVLSTCVALIWSDSFEIAGQIFVALEACTLGGSWALRARAKLAARHKPHSPLARA